MELKRSKSVGGFVSDPPFKKVKGKVDVVDVVNREGQFAKVTDVDIRVALVEVQVLETDTAYPYRVAELRFRDTESVNSRKGIFEHSIDACQGQDSESDVSPFLALVGKTVTVEREDEHLFFTRKNGEESKGTVWRVIDVEGASPVSAIDAAIAALDGKTKGDFTMAALTDPNIKRDTMLQSAIVNGAFFDTVKDNFTCDDKGVYHKK